MAASVLMNANIPLRIFSATSLRNILQVSSVHTSAVCQIKKHWNPKFRKLRSQKFIQIDLPSYDEYQKSFSELSKEEVRSRMKEKGVYPPQPHVERPIFISTSGDIFDPYVPPEGDGKVSFITKEGAKQKLDFVGKKGKSMMALRKLRKFDDDFELDEFLVLAQDVYMRAHNAMTKVREDKDELQLYVTERAYPEMLHNALDKTIHWKMIGLLEKPRLVQARANEVLVKENLFVQLTVRFHTQQMLAVYDRFGRLMYGSEILAKDVLEYIIFEKQMSNKYGSWRVHAKIIPDWMPPKDPVLKTFRYQEESPEEPPPREPSVTNTQQTQQLQQPPSDTPALATA